MTSLAPVVVGVDTHKDLHVDASGRVLGTMEVPTTAAGFRRLLDWARRLGTVARIGIEGTGAYGAGLARFLAEAGVEVVEVDRPNRQRRRRLGKNDTVDAVSAALAALAGDAATTPKAATGVVEAIRMLRVARLSARKARAQAANQLHALVLTAPVGLRARLEALAIPALVDTAVRFRVEAPTDPDGASRWAMRSLARRWQALDAEIADLDRELARLVAEANPSLCALPGVGTDVAGALLVTAGDNPGRLRSDAALAALCGVSPVEASSGRVRRHRLNRGGDRTANNALWRIVLVRMRCDPRTRAYVERRTKEGRTKREIMRCLKRYVAREVWHVLTTPVSAPLT
jgi:transposase